MTAHAEFWLLLGFAGAGVAVIVGRALGLSRRSIAWIAGIIAGIPVAGVIFFVAVMLLTGWANSAEAQTEYHSNPWLLSWVPATCCVTNDCCWQISERELRPLPDDEYEVRSTGQVLKRTAWSPDGLFYRCACDFDNGSGQWIRHQGAKTRCIFVPQRLF